jgi:Tfp pilus assembly protein PilV
MDGHQHLAGRPHRELVLERHQLGKLKMAAKLHRKKLHSESGITLIELMIASFVLTFGMLSLAGLLMVAIGNNGRSKVDTTATMLNQTVVEQISAVLENGGPGSITDCTNTNWVIDTSTGGATLAGSAIDFTQANPPNGFFMNFAECNGNATTYYDVRWNIQNLTSGGTYLVTVGAKPKGALPTRFAFALPVTMRVLVQSCPVENSHC